MQFNDDKKEHPEIVESENPKPEFGPQEPSDLKEVSKISELEVQVNHFRDQFLRANADFQNFKRRIEKEKSEWTVIAQASTLTALIQFFEDFDRAIEETKKNLTDQSAPLLEGFLLIQKNLKKTLADMGVEEMQLTGDFNPEFHEALVQVESSSSKSGEIVEVFGRGYTFKGKVLRYAKVSVAK